MLALGREPSAEELKKFTGLMAQGEGREVLEDLFWAISRSVKLQWLEVRRYGKFARGFLGR